ncbi:MAG: hypothetical protein GY799_31755 [Desulfobulbaceae bacterium]|nr:hypothetical protein [Desulfobulbaceae bacterium]
MKYAFIALIAIYLVTYGCSPDSSEKATDSHDKTAPVTLEKPHEAEMATAPADLHESAAPAHDEHQFPAKNIDKAVVVEEPAVVTELTEHPAEAVAVEPAEAPQPVVEEQQESLVVAQRVIVETQPASKEEQPTEVADSEMVVMPCGRTMARADIPENAPCLKQPQQTKQETAVTEPDLEAAILKLAEKTSEMIQATNQLIEATNKAISTVEAKQK